MKKIKYLALSILALSIVACEKELVDDLREIRGNDDDVTLPELNTNGLDFSKYVSVGASFTAGFTDGALFIAGQENSFPNILSQQFLNANGGEFTQPFMSDNIGGFLFNGMPLFNAEGDRQFGPRLFFNGAGPATLPFESTTEALNILGGTYNNVGVPGAKSFHVTLNGYGALNPYFGRMASSPTASMLEDALAQNPTFFTISELGGNDILQFATSGGTGVDQTGNLDPSTYGSNDITDPMVFGQVLSGVMTALTANGAKGLVTNVPYITDLPHFTTVPHNPLEPSNPDFGPQIPTLNSIFGAINGVYAFLGIPERSVVFSETEASPVVIWDESLENRAVDIANVLSASPTFPAFLAQFGLPPQAAPIVAGLLGNTYGQTRQATADDLLVLSSSSIIGTVNEAYAEALAGQGLPAALAGQFAVEGITLPLADKWVLIPSEQTAIRNASDAYNATMVSLTDANPNVALVDLNAILTEASSTGVVFDDFTMNTDLVFGGLVSLDGVHLTARGYALMAKKFLEVMDKPVEEGGFGTNFIASGNAPKAGDYPTNYSPELQ